MRHVVVVEDDAVNALLLRRVLERRGGYRVTVTEDPLQLMTMARAGEVHLVLMDVSLGDSRWEGERVIDTLISRLVDANACHSLGYSRDELVAKLAARLRAEP